MGAKMSPLCRKSNRCAACGALLLHILIFAGLFIGISMAYEMPKTPAVESVYITLAEPLSAPAPVVEEVPPLPEEEPPAPPEPLPDAVSVKPKPKPEPKKPDKTRPRPEQKPLREVVESPQEAVAPARVAEPEPAPDQKSMQNAISALLARLEKEKRYPNSARRLGLEGQVFISVDLDSRGGIRSYRLDGGATHPILQKSAMQAMERVHKKWQPLAISKAVTVQVPLRFELH